MSEVEGQECRHLCACWIPGHDRLRRSQEQSPSCYGDELGDYPSQTMPKEDRAIERYEGLASAIFCVPVRATDFHKLKETVDNLIDRLPVGQPDCQSRNGAVLRARFGLDGEPRTRAEIGEDLGLSAERIRQIESRALRMLRHPSRSEQLSGLIMRRKSR